MVQSHEEISTGGDSAARKQEEDLNLKNDHINELDDLVH